MATREVDAMVNRLYSQLKGKIEKRKKIHLDRMVKTLEPVSKDIYDILSIDFDTVKYRERDTGKTLTARTPDFIDDLGEVCRHYESFSGRGACNNARELYKNGITCEEDAISNMYHVARLSLDVDKDRVSEDPLAPICGIYHGREGRNLHISRTPSDHAARYFDPPEKDDALLVVRDVKANNMVALLKDGDGNILASTIIRWGITADGKYAAAVDLGDYSDMKSGGLELRRLDLKLVSLLKEKEIAPVMYEPGKEFTAFKTEYPLIGTNYAHVLTSTSVYYDSTTGIMVYGDHAAPDPEHPELKDIMEILDTGGRVYFYAKRKGAFDYIDGNKDGANDLDKVANLYLNYDEWTDEEYKVPGFDDVEWSIYNSCLNSFPVKLGEGDFETIGSLLKIMNWGGEPDEGNNPGEYLIYNALTSPNKTDLVEIVSIIESGSRAGIGDDGDVYSIDEVASDQWRDEIERAVGEHTDPDILATRSEDDDENEIYLFTVNTDDVNRADMFERAVAAHEEKYEDGNICKADARRWHHRYKLVRDVFEKTLKRGGIIFRKKKMKSGGKKTFPVKRKEGVIE